MAVEPVKQPVVKFDWAKIMPIIITAIMAILGTLVVQQPLPPVPAPTVEVVVPPAPAPAPTPTPVEPTPTPAPPVVVEPVPDVVSEIVLVAWIPTDSDGKRIESTALEALASTLTDGTYTVTRIPGQGEEFKSRTITVHTSGVPPPAPPGPKPAPVPVIGDKFTAMILEDRESNRDLPAAQLSALQSTAMLAYLDAKTATDADGVHEWRKWDDSLTPDQISEDEPWKSRYTQAYTDSKGVRPWLYVSNGKEAISIPFPADEASAMAVLKKLGGE